MSYTAAGRRQGSLDLLHQIWPFVRPHKWLAIGWLVFIILSSTASLALPVVIRYVIDRGFGTASVQVIDHVFQGLFAVVLAMALTSGARYFSITLLSERALAALRTALYDHIIHLDLEFFERSRVGELLSRLNSDTEVLQTLIAARLTVAVGSAVTIITSVIMMVWANPRLAVLAALIIPPMQFSIMAFGKRVQKVSRTNQDHLADAAAIINETFNAAPVVKAFAREPVESNRYADAMHLALASAGRHIGMRAALTGTVVTLMFSSMTLMLWAGARDVLAQQLSAGMLGQFMLYAFFASNSVSSLAEVWGDLQRAAGALSRIGELLTERRLVTDPINPQDLPKPVRGAVSFDRVEFHYPLRPDAPALHNFCLDIRPGETVALVGPSGAGKSTVFALLLRFYDAQRGRIRLDGVDLRTLPLAELRGAIAFVPQETVIFAASAADNIRFGRNNATDNDVRKAACGAEADGFICAMSNGYQSELGERGVRLSGGQRQRIAIARAILRNAPLLLLDEATSALDAQSEAMVQLALERLKKGRTTLVIAHRLATIQHADRIVVMDQGRIIAEGTHESLLAEGGLYAELAELQFLA
jgi:ATP-binding cassette, subfamily B, bacterial